MYKQIRLFLQSPVTDIDFFFLTKHNKTCLLSTILSSAHFKLRKSAVSVVLKNLRFTGHNQAIPAPKENKKPRSELLKVLPTLIKKLKRLKILLKDQCIKRFANREKQKIVFLCLDFFGSAAASMDEPPLNINITNLKSKYIWIYK